MFSYFLIILLFITVVILGYVVWKLLQTLGIYEQFIKDTYEIHREAYDRLIRADAEGVFESDSDINSLGWVFDTIFNVMVAVRDQFMDDMPQIEYETKQRNGQTRRNFVKRRRTQFMWEQRELEGDATDDAPARQEA
jgi:hypothetical protein